MYCLPLSGACCLVECAAHEPCSRLWDDTHASAVDRDFDHAAVTQRCRTKLDRHCDPTGRANARPMTGSAKQSRATTRMDCFVACAPRNDGKHNSAFSRRDAPELCTNHAPRINEGVGNAGCPPHPQPRVQNKISTRA